MPLSVLRTLPAMLRAGVFAATITRYDDTMLLP